ncbi:hypothetical protein L3X38_008976 [Prunus dulcis]|uniref:Uncharacterized protein n=1 Tax=Prunus dulcis TaxID=3755 RepID=A0AAD4ZXN8_PRUDU|nr:hypothetical protein L3X38_008976 [Prunus dulcis]
MMKKMKKKMNEKKNLIWNSFTTVTISEELPTILAYIAGSTAVADVDSGLQDRDALVKQLRVNLQAAQDRMRVYANKNRT